MSRHREHSSQHHSRHSSSNHQSNHQPSHQSSHQSSHNSGHRSNHQSSSYKSGHQSSNQASNQSTQQTAYRFGFSLSSQSFNHLPVSLRPTKSFHATFARPSPFHVNSINQLKYQPSLIDDIPLIVETKLRLETIDFMHQLCQELKIQSNNNSNNQSTSHTINQSILATSSQYWHVFFTHFSLGRFDRFEMAATCVLLGAKVEERRVRVDHIIRAYYTIRCNQAGNQTNTQARGKTSVNQTNNASSKPSANPSSSRIEVSSQSTKPSTHHIDAKSSSQPISQSAPSTTTPPANPPPKAWSYPIPLESSTQWAALRDRLYICELALLDAIEFNFDLIHPHSLVKGMLKEVLEYARWAPSLVERETTSPRGLAVVCSSFLLDSCKSSMCLKYPPYVIAAGAIAFTFTFKKIPHPTRANNQPNNQTTDPSAVKIESQDQLTSKSISPLVKIETQSNNQSSPSVKFESNGASDHQTSTPSDQPPAKKWYEDLYSIEQSIIDQITATILDCHVAAYTPDKMSAQLLVAKSQPGNQSSTSASSQQIAGSTQFALKHDFSDISADDQPSDIQSNHQPNNPQNVQTNNQSNSQSGHQLAKPAPLPQYVQLPMVRIELKPSGPVIKPADGSSAVVQPTVQSTNQTIAQSAIQPSNQAPKPSKKFAWDPKIKKKGKTSSQATVPESESKRPATPPSPFLSKRSSSTQSSSHSANTSNSQSNNQSPLSRPPSPFLESNDPRWDHPATHSESSDQSDHSRKRSRSEAVDTATNILSTDQSIIQSSDQSTSNKRTKIEDAENHSTSYQTDQQIDHQSVSQGQASMELDSCSVDQPADQTNDQSINQSINQSIEVSSPVVLFDPDQAINRLGRQSNDSEDDVHGFNDDNDCDDFDQSLDQAVDQSNSPSSNFDDQLDNQSVDHSINQSIDQSTDQKDQPATDGQSSAQIDPPANVLHDPNGDVSNNQSVDQSNSQSIDQASVSDQTLSPSMTIVQ